MVATHRVVMVILHAQLVIHGTTNLTGTFSTLIYYWWLKGGITMTIPHVAWNCWSVKIHLLILEKWVSSPSWMRFSSVLVRGLAVGKAAAGQGAFLLWVLSYWEEMEITTRILLLYHCQNMYGHVLDDWMVGHYGNDVCTCGKSRYDFSWWGQ